MEEREKQEEKNKRIGWLTSVGVQLVLLVLFYFIVAWKEPFPPIPEYGIELGFTTSAGAPSTSSPSQTAPPTEEPTENMEDEAKESIEESSEAEVIDEQPISPSEVESPVKVEETKTENTEQVVESKEQVDSRAVMNPSETDFDKTSDNPSEGEEEKEIDQRAIYGSQGTNTGDSEGANLALAGWVWDFKPKPDDQSDESGKIVYKIVVDQDGYLVKIETVTSTVSPSVERKYRSAVEKLTFSKTADYKTAPVSTGTITFIIKSR